jgi:hypothetical protein
MPGYDSLALVSSGYTRLAGVRSVYVKLGHVRPRSFRIVLVMSG